MSTPRHKEPGQVAFEAFFGHTDNRNPYRERWALSPNREAWAAAEKAVRKWFTERSPEAKS